MDDIVRDILSAVDTDAVGLDLDNRNLTQLPAEIGLLTHLEWLSLSGNRLTALPPEVGLLSRLEELCLSSNRLATVPSVVTGLRSLKILSLADNQLVGLPPEIGELAQLVRLELQDNRLASLPPETGQLVKLRQLWIQGNRLTELPRELHRLERLDEWVPTKNRLPPRHPSGLIAWGNPLVYPPAEILARGPTDIRRFLKEGRGPYTVYVDDNFHPASIKDRAKLGTFFDCESAVAACKKVVDDSLATCGRGSAAEILGAYKRFGEDPFILSRDGECRFSAWDYAERRSEELAAASRSPGG